VSSQRYVSTLERERQPDKSLGNSATYLWWATRIVLTQWLNDNASCRTKVTVAAATALHQQRVGKSLGVSLPFISITAFSVHIKVTHKNYSLLQLRSNDFMHQHTQPADKWQYRSICQLLKPGKIMNSEYISWFWKQTLFAPLGYLPLLFFLWYKDVSLIILTSTRLHRGLG
jgi:hypothetical protein